MWWAPLCILVLHIYGVASQGECTDLRGRLIAHGLHYVPGPDTCTLCVCDNGLPKVCKAVLCSPPQDCRSFRVGNTCCEFICLDDVVKPAESEGNVRVAVGGAAAALLLVVVYIAYRVRRQKRRRQPHTDDQRSLTSIGYISGSMGYMGGTCETALAGWKPPGNYLPRGEAPPPYDEVVAQCRQETLRMASEQQYHRTYPTTLESMARPDDPPSSCGHGYANAPRPMPQMANPATCYAAPLLQPAEPREPSAPQHPLAPNIAFASGVRLTGSLGAISNRGLLSLLQRDPRDPRVDPRDPRVDPRDPRVDPRDPRVDPRDPRVDPRVDPRDPPPPRAAPLPAFYAHHMHASHRTIPRISTAVDTTLLDGGLSGLGGFSRCERGLSGMGEVRRSFHRPGEVRTVHTDTGRSMPRNLNLASVADLDTPLRQRAPPSPDCINMRLSSAATSTTAGGAVGERPREDSATAGSAGGGVLPPPEPAPQTLPLTVDKPSCVCSYAEGASGAGSGEGADADDYRSECENCKAASSSRWAVEEEWADELEDGTQTLQRRAPPAPPPPPATSTLPQPVTKPRPMLGPPSNWENWFNTIHDSDTESEEE